CDAFRKKFWNDRPGKGHSKPFFQGAFRSTSLFIERKRDFWLRGSQKIQRARLGPKPRLIGRRPNSRGAAGNDNDLDRAGAQTRWPALLHAEEGAADRSGLAAQDPTRWSRG